MKINSILIQEYEPTVMNVGWLKPSTGELLFPLNGTWVSTNKKEESENTQDNKEPNNSDDGES
jgi:hypothetical protein